MKKALLGALIVILAGFISRVGISAEPPLQTAKAPAVYTVISTAPNQAIAVKILPPRAPRYAEGAPIMVEIPEFFYPKDEFRQYAEAETIGFMYITFMWPGKTDVSTGHASQGTYDYGGPACIAALRDVIRFATGEIKNTDGKYLREIVPVVPLTGNVGLYAFSHPGIAAVNVLANHGKEIPGLKYFIGRENPTSDVLLSVETGYWGGKNAGEEPKTNPLYKYPDCYQPSSITLDYSAIKWLVDRAHPKGCPAFGDLYVSDKNVPIMWNKRYYSTALTKALVANMALSASSWPADLATVQECERDWPYRISATKFPLIKTGIPSLKVMLVFAQYDHVQTAPDIPHVHQAYQGFRETAGLWVRLNPDRAYAKSLSSSWDQSFPDNNANAQPADWNTARQWAYPNLTGTKPAPAILMPLAAWAEMADRVRNDNWQNNLESVISNTVSRADNYPGVFMICSSRGNLP